HDIYHVGSSWDQVPNLGILARCSACQAPESMEHILLECETPRQREVWRSTENLWRLKFSDWLKMNCGLLLGCGLARFRSSQGKILPAKNRLFAILVSISMRIIWNLRNQLVFETHSSPSEQEVNNFWVKDLRECVGLCEIFTRCVAFAAMMPQTQLVSNTWSSTLFDEDSLPDDWT
ncbi:hypothetical protein C8R45DRAFT_841924, partial [Mycena sanguinolenta]